MGPFEIILGIALLILSVALTFCVLSQSSKDRRLSGSITGGAGTFLGKSKGKDSDKLLNTITTVLTFVFAAVIIVMYILVAKAY